MSKMDDPEIDWKGRKKKTLRSNFVCDCEKALKNWFFLLWFTFRFGRISKIYLFLSNSSVLDFAMKKTAWIYLSWIKLFPLFVFSSWKKNSYGINPATR